MSVWKQKFAIDDLFLIRERELKRANEAFIYQLTVVFVAVAHGPGELELGRHEEEGAHGDDRRRQDHQERYQVGRQLHEPHPGLHPPRRFRLLPRRRRHLSRGVPGEVSLGIVTAV